MATAIIDALTGSNASKQNPPALTARETRTLYRAMSILETHLKRPDSEIFNTPGAVRDYLVFKLAREEAEQFMVLFLDAQHRLIEAETMFRGTLTQTSVYPREVVKRALYHNAAAAIFAHNHPSGVVDPSASDRMLTNALKQALALVDVRVLDHFIVAGRHTLSFAERGLLSDRQELPEAAPAENREPHKRRSKTKTPAPAGETTAAMRIPPYRACCA